MVGLISLRYSVHILAALVTPVAASAQSWSYVFEPNSNVRAVNDAIDHQGALAVATSNLELPDGFGIYFAHPWNSDGTALHLIEDGELLSSIQLDASAGLNRYLTTLLPGIGGKLIGVGSVQLNYPTDTSRWSGCVSELDPFLGTLYDALAPLERPWLQTYAACRTPDLGYVGFSTAYGESTTTGSIQGEAFDVFKVPATLANTSLCTVYEGYGAFITTNAHPWPTGGLLTTSYSLWAPGAGAHNAGSFVVLEEDLCTIRFAFPALAPEPETDRYSDAIGFSPQALPTLNGCVMVSGQSNDVFYDTNQLIAPRMVFQVYDSSGNVLRENKFRSNYWADTPAIINSMDTTSDGRFYVANMMDMSVLNYVLDYPNAIRIMLLDTLLNIRGSYIVDGFADSTLYELRRVRAAADGGAYIMGRLKRLRTPEAGWQGWITKVSRMDMTTGIPTEQEVRTLRPYPNPSNDHIELSIPPEQGTLQVSDAVGRTVLSISTASSSIILRTDDLKAGTYHVVWTDVTGLARARGTWMKQ